MRLADCFLELFAFVRYLESNPEGLDPGFDNVRSDIDKLISRLESCLIKSDCSREAYDQTRFAVFAWVDEKVLASSWESRNQWLKHPLQLQYYKTTNAGEEFFQGLDFLLKDGQRIDQQDDLTVGSDEQENIDFEERNQILEVYTLCLSLGFTGMYFSSADRQKLEHIKNDCLQRLSKQGLGMDQEERIFPQAYPYSDSNKPKGFGRLFNPVFIILFLLVPLIAAGMYFAYSELLEYVLDVWFKST